MTVRKVPDKDQLKAYLDRGLTHAQIVESWLQDSGIKVTRTAISNAIGRYSLGGRRARHNELIPWSPIATEHNNNYDLRMLRLESRRRKGEELSEEDSSCLEAWKRQLREANAVVHYEYESEEGFWWVHAEEGEDLIANRGT